MKQKIYPSALTIAGSDSGGGAGIQADLKTFSSFGVYGSTVITAITAQNTCGVTAIQSVDPAVIEAQAEAVCSDIPVHALKLGMLHSPEAVSIVHSIIHKYQIPYVITDPVMVATSGDSLILDETIRQMEKLLFPMTTLLTPNIEEATRLTGIDIHTLEDMVLAGNNLIDKGCYAVLMKGGHFDHKEKTDVLIMKNCEPLRLTSPTVETINTHGTGCTLSSAIAASIALQTVDMAETLSAEQRDQVLIQAVRTAKEYISQALLAGAETTVGRGHGPVNHFFLPHILTPKTILHAD